MATFEMRVTLEDDDDVPAASFPHTLPKKHGVEQLKHLLKL